MTLKISFHVKKFFKKKTNVSTTNTFIAQIRDGHASPLNGKKKLKK